MQHLQLTIPAQDGDRASVKIKPREVKAWLEDLPFLDQQRCTRLVREQLRLMNRQSMPASQRLAILGEFLATYQRLNEARTADQALRTPLKHLCQDIAFGYKIVTHELVNKPSGFLEARNLPLALLGAIHILGLQLLDCYAGYHRAPRALWSECLRLFTYAWRQGRETWSGELPGYGEQRVECSFRRIALLRLADPYRLPAGIAVALHGYFGRHIDLCRIHGKLPDDKNCFPLRETFPHDDCDQEPLLYLELDDLLARMQADSLKLQQSRQTQAIGLPAEIPVTALLRGLDQTVSHWQNHPTRTSGREATHARIELVCGLDAVYCVLNKGRCFDPSLFLPSGHDRHIDLGEHPLRRHDSVQTPPEPFVCTGMNHSSGGLALRCCGARTPQPRVGQLLAVRRPGSQAAAGWVVAVCRWLVQTDDDTGFELGLQYLAREPRAVVIRENGAGDAFQPAIAAVQKRAEQRVQTLVTRSGDIRSGTRVTVYEQGRQQQVVCSEVLETGPGFERLLIQPAETESSDVDL